MLLHLADDEKFIDIAIELFERVSPGKNIYFIEKKNTQNNLQFIKTKNKNLIFDTTSSIIYKDIIDKIEEYDAIILHSCYTDSYKSKIVRNAPKSICFHWLVWGFDLYSHPRLFRTLYLPKTKILLRKNTKILEMMIPYLRLNHRFIFEILYLIIKHSFSPDLRINKCYKKINSVSSVIPEEYNLIQKFISSKMKYIPFKYGYIEYLVDGNENFICSKNDFLIGNSADYSNNHLDIFDFIQKNITIENKIYCPLSYGNGTYADLIASIGKKMFGNNFIPLIRFMPLIEYNIILQNCGNVVMNHLRQQAMGNIIASLWKGSRIFLNENNPIFDFLSNKGFIIFKTDEIINYKNLPDFQSLAKYNRPILKNIYGKETVLKEVRDLVQSLCCKSGI